MVPTIADLIKQTSGFGERVELVQKHLLAETSLHHRPGCECDPICIFK